MKGDITLAGVNSGNDWHIAGLADFNGDGKSDILWRNDNGANDLWFMNGNAKLGVSRVTTLSPDWHIESTGDFNDDGMADILWRHDNGLTAVWEMNGANPIHTAGLGFVGNDWHIIA